MLIISWVYPCNCTITEISKKRTILRYLYSPPGSNRAEHPAYCGFLNAIVCVPSTIPCLPSKKGEVLLLGQAEPTMVGIVIAQQLFALSFNFFTKKASRAHYFCASTRFSFSGLCHSHFMLSSSFTHNWKFPDKKTSQNTVYKPPGISPTHL